MNARAIPELVIFDSDGVLVDSEVIALTAFARIAAEEGVTIGVEDAVRSFRGVKMTDCVREVERRLGRGVRDSFVADVRQATALAFEAELRPVDGIHAALAEITIPVCVASNGPMSKLTHALGLTELLGHFEGRIFSAYEVGSWKPDPGLFLHAAQTMGAQPSACVVIEDSLSGARAARAAGMKVLGFAGGHPDSAQELAAICDGVFHRMGDLPALLAGPLERA
ncbi:HAD-IA family hydrolase [Bradyrhizobium sp. GCM10027634]|uniref:HAD-IA family hydrolase n=1 Tax=unclassified Bradyrhizobium TaxID=2631580 RepID=UPI00188A2FDB|nr:MULTISPECIES: HAD-IA family hydrolase [unclassified Bradyrhizobium]MDN5000419.1 HAD-IA family hydrolase [Bradyrhizobium sp. WYCCWR 12677]QOZ42824.1 HAD family hydrolase [Bradyrhizobium sp. CCBAU 53340]